MANKTSLTSLKFILISNKLLCGSEFCCCIVLIASQVAMYFLYLDRDTGFKVVTTRAGGESI